MRCEAYVQNRILQKFFLTCLCVAMGRRKPKPLHTSRADPVMSLPSQDGLTALHAAAAKDHTAVVRLLLEAGADTEAKDKVKGGRGAWRLFSSQRAFFSRLFGRVCFMCDGCKRLPSLSVPRWVGGYLMIWRRRMLVMCTVSHDVHRLCRTVKSVTRIGFRKM